jgi:uncharacterized phage-like protein YoqJ
MLTDLDILFNSIYIKEEHIMFTVSITGHRPNKLHGYNIHSQVYDGIRTEIQRCLDKLVQESGETELVAYSGMALGIDQIFVEELIKYNTAHLEEHFKIVAAIPFKGQECKWPVSSQKFYHNLLRYCDEIVYVSDPGYATWKMQKRNEYMVDHVDHVLAVWDGSAGGTGNCVSYAKQQKKDLVTIHPRSLRCTRTVYHS